MKKILFALLLLSFTAQAQMEFKPAPQTNPMVEVQNYQLKASALAFAGVGALAFLDSRDFPLIPALALFGVAAVYAVQSGIAWADVTESSYQSSMYRMENSHSEFRQNGLAGASIISVSIPIASISNRRK